MGQRMTNAHIPKSGNNYPRHLTAPDVIPRISCFENMT